MIYRTGALPEYDQLPRIEKLDLPHAWDYFGADDQLGTLNFLTDEVVRGALRSATSGKVIALNLPVDQPDPPLFNRAPTEHHFFTHDRNTWDDWLDAYYPQGSTQWDGFRHVRCREFGFFGGVDADPSADRSWLGVDKWAQRGIVGRGVLLDVETFLSRTGDGIACDEEFVIGPALLEAVAHAEGVEIQHGDILLVRTGWPAKYARLSAAARSNLVAHKTIPGLHAGEETARRLWNWHIAALVTDLPAVESIPGDPQVGSLHRRLLPLLGLPLGELFDLEALADHCATTKRFTFLFTSVPINLPGGCGSPGNALSIF